MGVMVEGRYAGRGRWWCGVCGWDHAERVRMVRHLARTHGLDVEADGDGGRCGAPTRSGGACRRPAGGCPDHADAVTETAAEDGGDVGDEKEDGDG